MTFAFKGYFFILLRILVDKLFILVKLSKRDKFKHFHLSFQSKCYCVISYNIF